METATASVLNLEKNFVTTDVQVIFDSGSQRTYVNEALFERLKFPVIRSERIIVNTFGNNGFQKREVNVVLTKCCTGHKNNFVEAICSQVICANLTNQNCKFVLKRYSNSQGLDLEDKSADGSKTIEILVGLDYCFEFLTWIFILQKSPWCGEFYGSLIGVMKNLFKKGMARARLTFYKILTILIEIETIINSRPLTYISDSHDESFITPYHLIHGHHIHEKYYKYDARNEITSDQILEDFSNKITSSNVLKMSM